MSSPFDSGFALGFDGRNTGSVINLAAHGLTAAQPIMFGNLVGGEGLEENVLYYVATEGLLADSFHVTVSPDGSGVHTFTTDITDGVIVNPDTYAPVVDGVMDPPSTLSAPDTPTLSFSDVLGVVRLVVTVPAYTDAAVRLRNTEVQVTDDYDGATPVFTDATILSIPAGTSSISMRALGSTLYAARTRVWDVFGNVSEFSGTDELTTDPGSDAKVVPDGSITTAKLEAGAITLYDENGQAVLTPQGWSGAWADFAASGLYNSCFRVAGPFVTIGYMSPDSIPYWTFDYSSGGSVYRGSTTTWPSGFYLRCRFNAIDTHVTMTSAMVAVIGGRDYSVALSSAAGAAAGYVNCQVKVNWYDNTGAFISPSTGTAHFTNATDAASTRSVLSATAPGNAAYATVVVDTWDSTTHNASNYVDIGAVSLTPSAFEVDGNSDLSLTSVTATGEVNADTLHATTNISLGSGVPVPLIADGSTGLLTTYGNNAFTTYTPTVGGDGTPTYSVRTGRYMKIGKMVFISIHIGWQTAGSSASTVTVTTPSNPLRSQRQVITGNIDGAATNGSVTLIANTSGSGATWDAIRKSTGGAFTGADMSAGAQLQLQGWYMEA